ncbi:histone acetyltransferase 1 [Clydaea vesicula]|uniref:Histone acetyltransferase type B catalytic subunit n=1 Tax=Clydaea vesicula TaxID=447962 RepID=A0AAD5XVZ3_9FUNG|nr:histone acetyltransferase 1 [Clydaea vesicula]KAJ3386739.1 histone acetyltransferase 1 [Lobulomyces angularis]
MTENGKNEIDTGLDEWTCNSNECFNIALVSTQNVKKIVPFKPYFTYPFFGQTETIVGYKNLNINLYYSSAALSTYLSINYTDKHPEYCQDIYQQLYEEDKIPRKNIIENFDTFCSTVEKDEKNFAPFGKKFHEYRLKADNEDTCYELYNCSFNTKGFKEYNQALQTFLLFYIEGSNFLDPNDTLWEFVLLYEKKKTSEGYHIYSTVGFVSFYPFFYYPDQQRIRISQFLILPVYQNKGHGALLYKKLFEDFLIRKDVAEVTVEEPNDTFQELRDKLDCRMLLPLFNKLVKLNESLLPLDDDFLLKIQKKFKLSKKQARRCTEILLLKCLQDSKNLDQIDKFRLFVKRRIYFVNKDCLHDMDKEERIAKIQEVYLNLKDDYEEIIHKL